VTYGETAAALRAAVTDLLVEADVPRVGEQRPLTAEESELVQRYRSTVLEWVNRSTQLVVPEDVSRGDWRWGPARLFADHLNRVTVATSERTPPADTLQLGTRHASPTVEGWRQAAVAATLGLERELGPLAHLPEDLTAARRAVLEPPAREAAADARDGALIRDYGDRLRVVDDNAALANAVILLDVRVGGRPGWHRLGGAPKVSSRRQVSAEGLLNAVDLCRNWTRAHALPTTIDEHGHSSRLTRELIAGPLRPGVAGALDALSNTLGRLEDRPNGDVMRQLIRSQAALSDELLRVAGDDAETRDALTSRRAHYGRAAAATANLGGRVGAGPEALIDAEQARALLRAATDASTDELRSVVAVLRSIDARIGDHLAGGVKDVTYLSATGHRFGEQVRGVRQAITVWAPIEAMSPARRAARSLSSALGPDPRADSPRSAPRPPRADLDGTIAEVTPPRTAVSGPLAGAPSRSALSRQDQRSLREASFPSPAVAAATEDYMLRRPKRSGGSPANKGKGKEPPSR
jgi:hypothetical protein